MNHPSMEKIIMTLVITLQIVVLLILNNTGHILAFSSYDQKNRTLSSSTLSPLQSITLNNHETIKKFTLIADDKNILEISPDNTLHPDGILYKAMTYNDTIPGPAIVVNQGDIFQITLYNKGDLVHSLDLHGIEGPSHALVSSVKPGENSTLRAKAEYPGVFMYHCDGDNLNGIWDHIASGMYGGIVVHPKNERPAKQFYMVFGEIYNTADNGLFIGASNTVDTNNNNSNIPFTGASTKKVIGSFDINKFLADKPDLILTNGMAYKYIPFFGSVSKIILNKNAEVFKVKPGELTRWYIVNAGPRGHLSFNFASGMIKTIHYNTNTDNYTNDNSAINSIITNTHTLSSISKVYEVSIPPGSAEEIEAIFPDQGSYVGNDHDIGRFLQGAGFVVLATDSSTSHDQPKGTSIAK